jgi:perosamine synthetase
MPAILELARRRGLLVVEDASEAHFAAVNGRSVGGMGVAGAFSFFGNKTVTTGEGGIVVTDDSTLADRVRYLSGQAMSSRHRYWHGELGFNYRMTNLQAAVGLAQLGKLEEILRRKRQIAMWYRQELSKAPGLLMPPELPGYRNIYWLFSFLLPEIENSARVAQRLASRGIDTRPFFVPIHSLPPYAGDWGPFPVASSLARRGLSLPSGPKLNRATVTYVAREVLDALLGEVVDP